MSANQVEENTGLNYTEEMRRYDSIWREGFERTAEMPEKQRMEYLAQIKRARKAEREQKLLPSIVVNPCIQGEYRTASGPSPWELLLIGVLVLVLIGVIVVFGQI